MDGQVVEAQVRQLRTAGRGERRQERTRAGSAIAVVHDGNWPRAFTGKCNHFPG